MRNLWIIVIIVISLLLGASTLTRGHEWGDDFAAYIMQAQSILNGTTRAFVEHNSFTIFESSNQIGPVAYPWGYPLIITPVYLLKGLSPLALKLPGLFFYAGFLICLYLLFRQRLTVFESLLLVSLFAFNPLLIQFLDEILSDIPFLFFSTLALLLITDEKRNVLQAALIGVTIFCAFFIRTTGILLLASLISFDVLRTWLPRADRAVVKKNMGNLVLACGVFAILWLLSSFLFPKGGEAYVNLYQNFKLETALGFVYGYFQLFHLFFGSTFIWQLLYYVLFIFFLIGVWRKRNEETFFIVFFVIWMVLLISWPAWQGPRFIFPLLPIFVYFAFEGMKFSAEKLSQDNVLLGHRTLYGFWLLLVGIFLFTSSANAYANLKNQRGINGPFDPYSKEVYEYIQENTPTNSIVVFFKPRAMRLMTGHDTFMSTECDRILKGNYLVLSRKVGKNQQIPPEEIESCHLPLSKVLQNSRFVVYQIQN